MAVPPPLAVTTISAASPTLVELLRLCPLRAGLSRVESATALILGNPKAWLGTAYHEVLAAAAAHRSVPSAAAVWEQAVRAQHQRAQAHPLDHRFGAPDRWPGYHLIRAMALMRAQEAVGEDGYARATAICAGIAPKGDGAKSARHERWLTAAGGRLVGRPVARRRGDRLQDR